MEITEDIKARVFGQYFGATVFGDPQDSEELRMAEFQLDYDNFEFCVTEQVMLVLRSLSTLTDEEAIELAKVGNPNYSFLHLASVGRELAQTIEKNKTWNFYYKETDWNSCYGFLQSKFFDIPNFYVGGRTLSASGLAVLKKKKVADERI